jgi:DNA polymerase-1
MDVNGQRAGGTTGMIISVRKIINDFRPSNVLVVWDGEGGSQRRRSIYAEYKAGRKVRLNEEYDFGETAESRLENMRKQRNDSSELLTILGIPQVRADAVEADDLIAYIAGKMDHPHGVIIVSTDQDFLQLIRQAGITHEPDCVAGSCSCPRQSEIRVYSPVKKKMYDRQSFISEFGVLPENFRMLKALSGDASDNIEGVKGFGFKMAAKSFPFLSERRVTADEVLEAAESLTGTLGKRLLDEKSRFLENLTLVDLSEPMLSATAARQAREALYRDLGCKEVDFRMRVVRDGILFSGNNFIGPFRELRLRRQKFLSTVSVGEPFDRSESVEGDQ